MNDSPCIPCAVNGYGTVTTAFIHTWPEVNSRIVLDVVLRQGGVVCFQPLLISMMVLGRITHLCHTIAFGFLTELSNIFSQLFAKQLKR